MSQKQKKWLAISLCGFVLLRFLSSWVSGAFAQIAQLRTVAGELESQLIAADDDIGRYSAQREKEITEQEARFLAEMPDKLNLSDVFRYFVRDFKAKHREIEFDAVVPEVPAATSIKADPDNPNVRARSARFRINATVPAALVIPYLDHVEKYTGLVVAQEISLASRRTESGQGRLKMDLLLDIYLSPKEWQTATPETPKLAISEKTPSSDASAETTDWFQTSNLNAAPEPVVEVQPNSKGRKKTTRYEGKFNIQRIIGDFLVVDDDLVELGESVRGWQVVRIDERSGKVTLKHGKTVKDVVVKGGSRGERR